MAGNDGITEDMLRKMVVFFKEKRSYSYIMNALKISESCIERYYRKFRYDGLPKTTPCGKEESKKIVQLAKDGASVSSICAKFNRLRSTVLRILKDNKAPIYMKKVEDRVENKIVNFPNPKPKKEPLPYIEQAIIILGERHGMRFGIHHIDGKRVMLCQVMQEANKILRDRGHNQIGRDSEWLV